MLVESIANEGQGDPGSGRIWSKSLRWVGDNLPRVDVESTSGKQCGSTEVVGDLRASNTT